MCVYILYNIYYIYNIYILVYTESTTSKNWYFLSIKSITLHSKPTCFSILVSRSHLNDSTPSSIHSSWIFGAVAKLDFIYLSSDHINQLHSTVTNACSLTELKSHVNTERKALLDLSPFYTNICSFLCLILIFICLPLFLTFATLDLIQRFIQMPFHPIK